MVDIHTHYIAGIYLVQVYLVYSKKTSTEKARLRFARLRFSRRENGYLEVTIRIFYGDFFSPCHLLSSPFYSLSLLAVTQIRGHIAGSSPPLPTTVRALHFYHEKISALSSLADSRRLVPTHATRSLQLILILFFLFLQVNS